VVANPYLLPAGTTPSDIPIFWTQFMARQKHLVKENPDTIAVDFSYIQENL
jgi:hypothetical protein